MVEKSAKIKGLIHRKSYETSSVIVTHKSLGVTVKDLSQIDHQIMPFSQKKRISPTLMCLTLGQK